MTTQPTIIDLREEIRHVQKRNPAYAEDNAFVLWFVLAYFTEDDRLAKEAVVGRPKDIGADCIYIDPDARRVFLLQAKYHSRAEPPRDSPKDVFALAELGKALADDNSEGFQARLQRADASVRSRLELARRLVRKGHRLTAMFATTGVVARDLETRVGRSATARSISRSYSGERFFACSRTIERALRLPYRPCGYQ
jgi:hypothetical protein